MPLADCWRAADSDFVRRSEMKLIIKRVGLFAAIVLGSAFVYSQLSPRRVGVTVVNGSGKRIQEVRVEYESGIVVGDMDNGQEKIVRLPPVGDTSFRIRAQFADNSELLSERRYAESGYGFRATIRQSSIAIEMTVFPRY